MVVCVGQDDSHSLPPVIRELLTAPSLARIVDSHYGTDGRSPGGHVSVVDAVARWESAHAWRVLTDELSRRRTRRSAGDRRQPSPHLQHDGGTQRPDGCTHHPPTTGHAIP